MANNRSQIDANEIRIEDPMDFLTTAEREAFLKDLKEREEEYEDEAPVRHSRPKETHRSAHSASARHGQHRKQTRRVREEEDWDDEETSPFSELMDLLVRMASVLLFIVILGVAGIIAWLMWVNPMLQARGTNPVAGQEASAPQEAEGERVRVVNASSGLNLRTGPGTEYEAVTNVRAGTELIRTADENGWSTVVFEGQTLYCASNYLEVIGQ